MLETLDLTRSLTKSEYRNIVEPLDIRLGELQRALRAEGIATVVVFEGWGAAGKGTCIGALMQPLDPRGYRVYGSRALTEGERLRPFLWRYWVRLPAAGEIALFDRSWYTRVLQERVEGKISGRALRDSFEAINELEQALVDSGIVIVKFWLHISAKEQARRFKKIARDPAERWKVTREDWREHRHYDEYLEAAEEMLERTETAPAPWTVVEAEDRRFAVAKVFETVASAWDAARKRPPRAEGQAPPAGPVRGRTRQSAVLRNVDLGKRLADTEYHRKLEPLQKELRTLEHECYMHRLPVVVVCEGWDAAGKGGAIRRATAHLDPRGFEVVPVSAPNDVERAHHYLWRFWHNIPKAGHLTIFDRSWYGRVLVERVEGFCTPAEWRRAYHEINAFEAQLAESGTVIVKLWFHIDRATQLARFRERERVGYKKWKITHEDWRNRKKWPRYEEAAAEMIERTSTSYAPWKVIPANDKNYARVEMLRLIVRAVKKGLGKRK
jgi:polyphosphate kinase 2 (PPK2 family)